MFRRVEHCSPWLREKAGDFYGDGIKKKLFPRLSECIAIHDDYVEK
jgi:hypothetical protein